MQHNNSQSQQQHSRHQVEQNQTQAQTKYQQLWQTSIIKSIMDIKINSFLGVAAWKWTAKHEDCGICRNPFDDCCADCKAPGDDCPLVSGRCSHCFHIHCIEKWLNQPHMITNQLCPMCRQEWIIAS